MEEKRIGGFVDAANIYPLTQELGVKLEFGAFMQHLRHLGKVVHANLYAVRTNGDKDRGFLVAMRGVGFTRVRARHPRMRPDGQAKSDADTALVMDVMEAVLKQEIDVVVIVSGDSDYTALVERLVDRGIQVDVIGPDRSTAWEMIVAASHFLYVSQVPGFLTAPKEGGECASVTQAAPITVPACMPTAQRPG